MFPTTIGIGYGTDLSPDAGKRAVAMEDGAPVVITYFDQSTFAGTIEVPFASAAERDTIRQFYLDNKNLVWTFIHPGDGKTYSLLFANEPREQRVQTLGDEIWQITIPVVGTR